MPCKDKVKVDCRSKRKLLLSGEIGSNKGRLCVYLARGKGPMRASKYNR